MRHMLLYATFIVTNEDLSIIKCLLIIQNAFYHRNKLNETYKGGFLNDISKYSVPYDSVKDSTENVK